MSRIRPFVDFGTMPQVSLHCPETQWGNSILGGVGCNFFLGRSGNLPPLEMESHWDSIIAHLRDLQVGMLRIGFLTSGAGDIAGEKQFASPWNDEEQTYDQDHSFFHILKKLDDLAEELSFPLMIDPWWVPQSMQVKSPEEKGRGAPRDIEEYAENFVMPLLRIAVERYGCRNITQLGLLNEPIWNENDRNPANFAVPPGEDQLQYLTGMYAAVRASLNKAGFTAIQIVGPSALCAYQFPMADFLASGCDPTPCLDVLDHHFYMYHNDFLGKPNSSFFSTHEMVDGAVRRWCDFAKRQGKPFISTEMGSFAYGRLFWGERDLEGPASHTAAISDAQFIVRSLAHGTEGFLRWAFSVPAHYDGRWSLVEWDENAVYPVPNTYPMYRELMRAVRPGSQIMPVKLGSAAGRPCPVHAVAVKTDNNIHLLIVNAQPGMNHDILIGPGPWKGKTMTRTVVDETRKGSILEPVEFPAEPELGRELVLSPYSLTVMSTKV